MSYQTFRDFLDELEKHKQVVNINDDVFPEPDIRGFLRAAADLGEQGPAILFNKIKGYSGFKVAGHVHGSWANHALLLGMAKGASIREQFFRVKELWESDYKGEIKSVGNAPCQEVVIENNINLYEQIPLFRVNRNDGGFYFSKACVISRDPEDPENEDKENVGMYRVMVQGPDTLGMQALVFHDFARHLKKAEEKNKPIPVVITLSNPPFLSTMAATPLAYDESEYKTASRIMGEPFQVAKAIRSNLNVPAGAEFVIEGEVIPRERYCEGPFGEFPGSYSGVRKQIRIKVKRLTHRKNPIFENLYIGKPWTEHDTMIGLWTALPIYKQLKADFPEVTCVNALYQHGLSIIVSSDMRFGGFAKTLGFKVATTPHGISYAKNIIIVDGDVDPYNLPQVMWALSTRVRADKDVSIIKNTPGMPLDPCSVPPGMGNKLIIDATTPAEPDSMREVTMIENPDDSEAYINRLKDLLIGKPQGD